MSSVPAPVPRAPAKPFPLRRAFAYGFVAGALVTVPLILLALLTDVGEVLLTVLVPGAVVLRPLAGVMAECPGPVNVGLGAAVNGLVYGTLAVTVLVSRRAVRR